MKQRYKHFQYIYVMKPCMFAIECCKKVLRIVFTHASRVQCVVTMWNYKMCVFKFV